MRNIAFILALVAIVAGGWYLAKSQSDSPASEPTSTADSSTDQKTQGTNSIEPSSPPSRSGAYVDYTDSIITSTAGTKILFFHAPWCPQCRALEKSIKSGLIPEGVTIIKVDYDSNQLLRQKYGVTIQTTLVKIDDSGNLVEKYVAYDSPTLAAVTENLL